MNRGTSSRGACIRATAQSLAASRRPRPATLHARLYDRSVSGSAAMETEDDAPGASDEALGDASA
jgi:hypothetical protein